jgi:FkbM family methyltransferase
MKKRTSNALLKRVLSKISGHDYIQRCLEKNIRASLYLMGVGSGSDVSASGEEAVFRALGQRFAPPYCIFDVGSNQGQFLQIALKNIPFQDLSIHCFEPGRETFKALTRFAAGLDEHAAIKLNNIGVGNEKGQAVLHFDQHGSALASLTKRNLDHFDIAFEESERVEIDTIDSYCVENVINHIHLLKIDIEGHELDALVGAKKMLESKSVDMVCFEFGGTDIDTRTFFRDFWRFFSQVKMRLFRITPSGYLSPIDSYREIHEQFASTNFLAISND